ncbi:hypothetical protein K3G63_04730 [Hymenobacter sp. HSC-4F20]|uniref:hypothetical protein n=1 Tax=Hymenobacter sp. HSC-4F20 TaxID=2864135 RepID=UPI001C735FC4|nr:hypothetical protein [Hymenobacter sp. HSC-4F20]MBX0289729.1 hypothetical protein [Hymenobacter sp. HSC-4F20]
MTISKIDKTQYTTPAFRAGQQGNGAQRTMIMVNKINEIIESLATVAVASTVAAMNTQLESLLAAQNDFLDQLNAVKGRVAALEIAPSEPISNVSEAVSISLGGVLNLGALNNTMNSQGQTINKILSVMRTRKEIKI